MNELVNFLKKSPQHNSLLRALRKASPARSLTVEGALALPFRTSVKYCPSGRFQRLDAWEKCLVELRYIHVEITELLLQY